MIRAATQKDYPSMRSICEQCFTTDGQYLDFFFKNCTSKASFVYVKDGQIVSAIHTMGISYVSAKRSNNGYRTFYPGLYVYGVGTLPQFRNRGYSTALLYYIRANASKIGWNFLITRPSESNLIDFYTKKGFSTPIYRSDYLPLFENGANILNLNPVELFKMRDKKFLSNYFQWSHIMLDYIIKEARINTPPIIPAPAGNNPFALLCSLTKDFHLDSNSAIFSYPME